MTPLFVTIFGVALGALILAIGGWIIRRDIDRAVDREMEKVRRWRDEEGVGIFGTCDWGDCDRPANRIRDGLPVCDECLRKPEE